MLVQKIHNRIQNSADGVAVHDWAASEMSEQDHTQDIAAGACAAIGIGSHVGFLVWRD